MKIQKICLLSILMAGAIIISIVESFIPSFGIPGIKLGLANIVILLVLYEFGIIDALIVNLGRVFLSSLLRGTIFQMGFFMSLSGAILSLLIMWLVISIFKKFSLVGVSIFGAVFHIIGQFIVGLIVLQNSGILYYLPILFLLSLATGIFNGFVCKAIVRTQTLKKFKEKYNI